jgi:hypothetical protein
MAMSFVRFGFPEKSTLGIGMQLGWRDCAEAGEREKGKVKAQQEDFGQKVP